MSRQNSVDKGLEKGRVEVCYKDMDDFRNFGGIAKHSGAECIVLVP